MVLKAIILTTLIAFAIGIVGALSVEIVNKLRDKKTKKGELNDGNSNAND